MSSSSAILILGLNRNPSVHQIQDAVRQKREFLKERLGGCEMLACAFKGQKEEVLIKKKLKSFIRQKLQVRM